MLLLDRTYLELAVVTMIPIDIVIATLISPATNVEQKIYSNNKSIGVYYNVCKLEKQKEETELLC
jgi:hypothetical protein